MSTNTRAKAPALPSRLQAAQAAQVHLLSLGRQNQIDHEDLQALEPHQLVRIALLWWHHCTEPAKQALLLNGDPTVRTCASKSAESLLDALWAHPGCDTAWDSTQITEALAAAYRHADHSCLPMAVYHDALEQDWRVTNPCSNRLLAPGTKWVLTMLPKDYFRS